MDFDILQWWEDYYKHVLTRMPSDADAQKYAPIVAAVLAAAEGRVTKHVGVEPLSPVVQAE